MVYRSILASIRIFLLISPILLNANSNSFNYCSHNRIAEQTFNRSIVDQRSDSIDLTHTILRLDITDFVGRTISGSATISLKAKLNSISTVRLDLLGLLIDSVRQNQLPTSYNYNDTALTISLLQPLNNGQSADISIYYHGQPVQEPGDWGGFYWTNSYAYNLGVTFNGTPHNYGRVWFPCFDNFVERSTFDFHITTSNTNKAFTNGILQSTTDNGNGTQTWFWKMNQSIPSYLVSVAVSNYQTIDWTFQSMNGPVPVQLGARSGDTSNLKNAFTNLLENLEAFENAYGPYQFDRAGYVLVPFNGGAMEHATNIAYPRFAIAGGTQAYEDLMAHELAHMWWGDLVTCRTAEDMWLNEGWASYSENIFFEQVYGKDRYKDAVRDNHAYVLQFAHILDDGYRAVSGIPHEYTYGSTVYNKGSEVAHTLRGYLGDTLFFECLSDFLIAYQFTDISSETLRDYLSTCSGMDLTAFFENWVFNPGFPNFTIDRIEAGTTSDQLRVFIRQRLNNAPVFFSDVPIDLTLMDDQMNKVVRKVMVQGECSFSEITIPSGFNWQFAALDLEERLSDATTDLYKVIGQIGAADFPNTFAQLTVQQISDSAFVRVAHHWVAPDPMKIPIEGLSLSDYRFWQFDGIWPAGFHTNATLVFNGSLSTGNGYLDNTFITNSEDSLVLMYRANSDSDWVFADSFQVNSAGSKNDKVGSITLYDLQKGEYAMAIWDVGKVDSSSEVPNCLTLGLEDPESDRQDLFSFYPNPARKKVTIAFERSEKAAYLQLYNANGQKIDTFYVSPFSELLEISLRKLRRGIYVLSLVKEGKIVESEKLILQ